MIEEVPWAQTQVAHMQRSLAQVGVIWCNDVSCLVLKRMPLRKKEGPARPTRVNAEK
jgi:hypothetical protein